jgi:hypothetical protein
MTDRSVIVNVGWEKRLSHGREQDRRRPTSLRLWRILRVAKAASYPTNAGVSDTLRPIRVIASTRSNPSCGTKKEWIAAFARDDGWRHLRHNPTFSRHDAPEVC